MLRLGSKIAALALEQVIGDEGDRQFAHRLFAHDLAAKPLLQAREDREAIERIRRELVLWRDEDDQLAVDRRARGQRARQRLEIGIGVGNQLFAARPQAPVLAALQELRADAVVLPFDDPVRGRSQRSEHLVDRAAPRLREIKRIGFARVERLRFRLAHLADQRLEIRSRRDPPRLRIADQPLRHVALVDARDFGQRLHHLQPRHADPQFAGDQLEEGETLVGRELANPLLEPRVTLFLGERGKRQQPLAHPDIERNLFAALALRQKQRQHLGQVADRAITLRAKPVRIARAFDREAPKKAGRRGLARLAAAQEIDGPGRARPLRRVSLGGGEKLHHRRLLGAGRGAGIEPPIERSKGLHASASAGAPPLASPTSSSSP